MPLHESIVRNQVVLSYFLISSRSNVPGGNDGSVAAAMAALATASALTGLTKRPPMMGRAGPLASWAPEPTACPSSQTPDPEEASSSLISP